MKQSVVINAETEIHQKYFKRHCKCLVEIKLNTKQLSTVERKKLISNECCRINEYEKF